MSKLDDLKEKLAKHRARGEENSGAVCLHSETGPAGFALIDAVIVVLDAQQEKIAQLEEKITKLERNQVG